MSATGLPPSLAHTLAAFGSVVGVPLLGFCLSLVGGGARDGTVVVFLGLYSVSLSMSAWFGWAIMVPMAALHWLILKRWQLPWWTPPLSAGVCGCALSALFGLDTYTTIIIGLVSATYGLMFGLILALLSRPLATSSDIG